MRFHKNRPPGQIGPHLHLQGQATFVGSGIFSAKLDGDLFATDQLIVDRSASIQGSLHAKRIDLAGSILGRVESVEHTYLQPSAQLQGALVARSVQIEAGATFQGDLTIGSTT